MQIDSKCEITLQNVLRRDGIQRKWYMNGGELFIWSREWYFGVHWLSAKIKLQGEHEHDKIKIILFLKHHDGAVNDDKWTILTHRLRSCDYANDDKNHLHDTTSTMMYTLIRCYSYLYNTLKGYSSPAPYRKYCFSCLYVLSWLMVGMVSAAVC